MPLDDETVPDLGSAPTASDIIFRFIRGAIVGGQLDEGDPIRQDVVARQFNVSKIPVREALKRLEAEGLVTFQKNRGAIVSALSEPEIAQIFEVRAILESNALRLSVPHMTEATFARAEARCKAFAEETDAARWAVLNWDFHACLYEDADRPYLVSMIRSVNDRIERYLRIQLALSGGQVTADREHRQILAACRTGDAEAAARLLHDHIMHAYGSLADHQPAQGTRPKPAVDGGTPPESLG